MIRVTQEAFEAAEKNLGWLGLKKANMCAGPIAQCEPQPCGDNVHPRRPQVHQELEELGYAIDSLEKAIAGLHDRLTMVTRVVPQRQACPPETSEIQKVPLSGIISEYRWKVRLFQNIVTDLTDNIEV